jgi:hypothetical protein
VLSASFGDLRFSVESEILDMGEEVARDGETIILRLVGCKSSLWVREVNDRLGVSLIGYLADVRRSLIDREAKWGRGRRRGLGDRYT